MPPSPGEHFPSTVHLQHYHLFNDSFLPFNKYVFFFFFKLSRLHTQCRLWTLRSRVAYSISGARQMPAKFAFYFGDMCSCLLFLQHCKLINYLKGVVRSCLFSLSFKTLSRICACFPEYCKRSLLIWHKHWSSRKNWVEVDDFEPETGRIIIPLTKKGRT